jgi:hypothetical protein
MADEIKTVEAAAVKTEAEATAVVSKINAPVTEALAASGGWIHTHPKLAAAAVLGIFVVVVAMIIKLL